MTQELASNYANAAATLLTGFFAFWVYKKSQIDKKREAAKLILLEIHKTEDFLKNFSEKLLPIDGGFQQRLIDIASEFSHNRLYPLDLSGWSSFKHILASSLSAEEIGKIEDFDVIMKKFSSDFIKIGSTVYGARTIKFNYMYNNI